MARGDRGRKAEHGDRERDSRRDNRDNQGSKDDRDFEEVGGLWKSEDRNDEPYMSLHLETGKLEDFMAKYGLKNGTDKVALIAFPNKFAVEGDNRPDYRVFMSNKQPRADDRNRRDNRNDNRDNDRDRHDSRDDYRRDGNSRDNRDSNRDRRDDRDNDRR